MNVVFVTGNKRKITEAQAAFKHYGLNLETKSLDIDEIQHHNPQKITEAKAKSAYQILKRPVFVHDSHWSIPALNGFPGGYMKDVTTWLEPEDFLNLMKDKVDRSINLIETIAYFDGQNLKTFSDDTWRGEFVDSPRGKAGFSIDKVVRRKGQNKTVSELFDLQDAGDEGLKNRVFNAWKDFAKWYRENREKKA